MYYESRTLLNRIRNYVSIVSYPLSPIIHDITNQKLYIFMHIKTLGYSWMNGLFNKRL